MESGTVPNSPAQGGAARSSKARLAEIRHVKVPEDARLVFRGTLFDVFQWEERQFDGRLSTFEMARRPDSVNVVAVRASGELLLVQQEQPGVAKPFYDFPGGRVDGQESITEAACREMLEETGFTASEFRLIHSYQATDRVDALTHVYCARDAVRVADPNPDSGEKLTPVWLRLDEVKTFALANHRLAVVPVLLAATSDELVNRDWIGEIPSAPQQLTYLQAGPSSEAP